MLGTAKGGRTAPLARSPTLAAATAANQTHTCPFFSSKTEALQILLDLENRVRRVKRRRVSEIAVRQLESTDGAVAKKLLQIKSEALFVQSLYR